MSNLGLNLVNIDDTVNALMMYQNIRLHNMQAKYQAESIQLSAHGTLQSLFGNFQTALTNLGNAFNTIAYQATSNNPLVSASVTNNNVGSGSHTIDVTSIATTQSFTSGTFTSNNTGLGIGETLTFTNAINSGTNFSVQVKSTDTLQNIRDNINNSPNNIGVTASIIMSNNGGTPQYNLLISTTDTGTANQIAISGDTGNNFNFNQTNAATDAVFKFDGYDEVESSNTISDVLDGLTFTLSGASSVPYTAVITTSSNGTDVGASAQTAIQNMLTAYNSIITFLDGDQEVKAVIANDDGTKSLGKLYNNAFSMIKAQLQSAVSMIYNNGAGNVNSLATIGINLSPSTNVVDQYDPSVTTSSTGSLQINPTTSPLQYGGNTQLSYMLSNNFNTVKEFFTDPTSGFNVAVNKVLNTTILPGNNSGSIWNATNAIDSLQTQTDNQIMQEQKRLDGVKDDLIMQYSRLNAIISKFQGLSDYLDKQFSYMEGLMKK